MKYSFFEMGNTGLLDISIEDVPMKGSKESLEKLFSCDIDSSLGIIENIDLVLSGKEACIESGTNMFLYTITAEKAVFTCCFENYWEPFEISTKLLRELAVAWHNEFVRYYGSGEIVS